MKIALIGAECEENLALRYIWAALEKAGHDVSLIPFNHRRDEERAARTLAGSGAPLAGFSLVFTYRAKEFAALARRARDLGWRGHLTAGGHFAAFNAENLLRDVPAFDSIARGEGEEIMAQLAANLGRPGSVAGLVWRDAAGEIRINAPALKPPDLDALPPPVRKVPYDRYLDKPIVNILSSRGCTHHCRFCSIAAWHRFCGGKRFRQRRPEAVAAEMADLYARGVRVFNFHDDNFFLGTTRRSLDRARALKRELERHGVGRIAFAVKARPDRVDEELFALLKSIGLFRVFLGVEAGTARALQELGRGQTKSDNERALEICNRLDLHACFNLLLLNPESTLEDFRANVNFLRKNPGNPMNFCRTEIYAGTPLEDKLRAERRLIGDYWGWDYRIRDPRAQLVFELIYSAFEGRSYHEVCVQHATMDVDYEHQLLAHFGRRNARRRKRVKNFIAAANRNTCDYLDEVAAAAGHGFADRAARDRFRRDLRRRLLADNERLMRQAAVLLDEIRRAAAPRRPGLTWLGKAAAAAGLFASLAATDPALGGTHMGERAPTPIQVPVDSPLRQEIATRLLPAIARLQETTGAIDLHVTTDRVGRLRHLAYCVAGGRWQQLDRPQRFALDEAVGQTDQGDFFAVSFTAEEFAEAARAEPWDPDASLGDPDLVRGLFSNTRLGPVADAAQRPGPLEIELLLDQEGVLRAARVVGVDPATNIRQELPLLFRQRIDELLAGFRCRRPGAQGRRFQLQFSREEVERARQNMHAREMVALPTTHPTEMAATPTAVPEPTQEPEPPDPGEGAPALIIDEIRIHYLPRIAAAAPQAGAVTLKLELDGEGRVAAVTVEGENLPPRIEQRAAGILAGFQCPDPRAIGRNFTLVFKAEEVAAARGQTHFYEPAPPPPHMFEMAPEPTTHPAERAPLPHNREMAPRPRQR